jgi:hypothetical protein
MSSLRGLPRSVRRAVAVSVALLTLCAAAVVTTGPAAAATSPDRTVRWSGSVRPRTLAIPGLEGGIRITVIASFRLWIPSGGTWYVESALNMTGVRKATAPGSLYGRVAFGHALECGPDTLTSAGRVSAPNLYVLSGTNLLYDRHSTTTARGLWRAVPGYNRCQLATSIGRDDLAVAGKSVSVDGGYVRLVGRGVADGQAISFKMPGSRLLSSGSPSLTSPNVETYYTAPARMAIAGNAASTPAIRFVDVLADAYVTTCYSSPAPALAAAQGEVRTTVPDGTDALWGLPCPRSAGVLSAVTYQSMAVVIQYNADGTPCRQTNSPLRGYSTTGYVHHQEVRNRLIVPVDPTCSSRRFRAKLFLRWTSGSALWVQGGHLSRVTVRPLAA